MTSIARLVLADLADDPDALEELRALLAIADGERLLKTAEAADRLGVHPRTLTNAAGQGRVKGALRVGTHAWRYRASELELLPPIRKDLGTPGVGRGVTRLPGPSSATSAIRSGKKQAA